MEMASARALAEHIEMSRWPKHSVSRKNGNQRAGAPLGIREGACAPQTKGIITAKEPKKLRAKRTF